MIKDDPIYIRQIIRHGTDLYPTYTVVLKSGMGMDYDKWEERWDPWNVDLTWDKENKVWDCNDGNYYKIAVLEKDRRWVNDMLENMRTDPKPKEKKETFAAYHNTDGTEKKTRVEQLNDMFPGLNLPSCAGDYPLGLGC